jgi:hypothetical protein
MAFLIDDDSVRIINSEQYKINKELPKGVYKLVFSKMGSYLEKTELKLTHGKIYGNSQEIANHVVEAYKLNPVEKNMGVLLSGDRGLGKTLTTRLIIEQLINEKTIIVVSEYTSDLSDFLTNIKNCVILMDEFEKFMGGKINGEDEDSQTKQETILSILDGNTGCTGNLFLLTVNDTYKLDDNLISRPGRIRYHYKYISETAAVVRNYCEDNLIRKELTEDVVKALGAAKYVSMDIISSFVDELNHFPNSTPDQVMKYFNIEANNGIDYTFSVVVVIGGRKWNYAAHVTEEYELTDGFWLACKRPAEISKLQSKQRDEWTEEEKKFFEAWQDKPNNLRICLDEDAIPTYIYGSAEIDPSTITILNVDSEEFDQDSIEVLKVSVKDNEWKSFSKKYAL